MITPWDNGVLDDRIALSIARVCSAALREWALETGVLDGEGARGLFESWEDTDGKTRVARMLTVRWVAANLDKEAIAPDCYGESGWDDFTDATGTLLEAMVRAMVPRGAVTKR